MEIDTPPSVYLSPREFTGMLVDRQTSRPLFSESGGRIASDLLSTVDREGDRQWIFRVAPDGRWDSGDRIRADEVVQRMAQGTRSPQQRWLAALIGRCEVIDTSTLAMTTRFAVADLEAALAAPALSPKRADAFSGAYAREPIDTRRTLLRSISPERATDVELVTTVSRTRGRADFARGALDVGWGIGVPASFWEPTDRGPFLESAPLDMFAVVVAGRSTPDREARRILHACRLSRSTDYGVLATASRYSDTRSDPAPALGGKGNVNWPLYYTPFPPNAELARDLAAATAGSLRPVAVTYNELLRGRVPDSGFSLQIHSAATAGDPGLLIESAVIAGGLATSGAHLREQCLQVWGAGSRADRRTMAEKVEPALDRLLRRRVVGRMLPRFRTPHPLPLPRSGWFDFTQLRRQKESNDG
ncbi:hypothetical protein [Leifsonia shinshuensis]